MLIVALNIKINSLKYSSNDFGATLQLTINILNCLQQILIKFQQKLFNYVKTYDIIC